ncbi:hypothetical protein Tco_1101283, partial [Tanacetum coccineum]
MSRMVNPLISLNYLPASPDYFPASPGNTFSLSENGLIPLAISSSHDDSYIHEIQAYDANNNEPLIPPQVPMVSSTTLPPSPVLSPMFDFFIPEEILPPHCWTSEKANGTPLDVNNDLQLSGLKMPTKRTSTSVALAMTQAAIRQLVADSVAAALEAQAANMANTDNTNRNPEPRET